MPLDRSRALTLAGSVLVASCQVQSSPRPSVPEPAPATGPTEHAKSAPFTIVDTLPTLFAATDDVADADLAAAIRRDYVDTHPHVFTPEVLSVDPATIDEELTSRTAQLAADYRALEPTMRRLRRDFAHQIDSGTQRFMEAFPDFSWEGQCYLVASLQGFNGAVREVRGAPALLFGLDVIASAQPDSNLMVLLHHELFHFYQSKDAPNELWAALWAEGLATYASIALNPGTSDDAGLPLTHMHDPRAPALDAPERRLRFSESMPQHEDELGRMLLAKLESSDRADYATFFLGRADPQLGSRPVRTGYWFGLQVARRIVQDGNLAEYARRSPTTLRKEIRMALQAAIEPQSQSIIR